MFSLVFFGGARLARSAVFDTSWPVGRSVSRSVGVGWGEGVSTECLSAVVLWVSSGSPHSAALPPGLHLTLPQPREKKQLLQD